MKKFIFILTITLLFSSIKSETSKEEVIKSFEQKLDDLGRDYVYNKEWYIRNILTTGDISYYNFKVDEYKTKIESDVTIPQAAKDKIKGIIFSKSLTFQGLSTFATKFVGRLEEYIGIAKNNNGVVDVILIRTESQGQTVMQYNQVTQKRCRSYLFFWTKCQDIKLSIPRGFTPTEINTIENALLYSSMAFANQLLLNLKTENDNPLDHILKFTTSNEAAVNLNHRPVEMMSSSNIYDSAAHSVLNLIYDNYFLNFLFGDETTNNKKLSELESKVKVDLYENIKRADLILFSQTFINKFSKEVYDLAKISIDESLFTINKHNRNEIIRLILPENKKLTFYEIMIHYSSSDDDYDFEIRKIQTEIDIFYNLVLLKNGNERKYFYPLVKETKLFYDGELTALLSILEMISQKKGDEVRKSKLENGNLSPVPIISTQPESDKNTSSLKDSEKINSLRFLESDNVFDYLINALNKYSNMWSDLLGKFKSTNTCEVKEKLVREGFDKFDESAQIQVISGLRREGLDKFVNLISNRLNVPEDKRQDIENIILESDWMENNMWSNFNLLFSLGTGGKVKYASIFSHKDNNHKFHFIISEIHAEFELADDIIVMTRKISILGGLFDYNSDKVIRIPEKLKPEDLQIVSQFFDLVVFKHVASQFGIQLELPK
jgi:hypothetical protein